MANADFGTPIFRLRRNWRGYLLAAHVLGLLMDLGRRPTGWTMARTNLTARERRVLELLGSGRSTKEIAQQLGVSIWTAASHRKRICEKLGVHTTAELVALSSAKSRIDTFVVGRRAVGCHLTVDLGTGQGRVQLSYSGRLKRTPGVATVRIGRNLYYFSQASWMTRPAGVSPARAMLAKWISLQRPSC